MVRERFADTSRKTSLSTVCVTVNVTRLRSQAEADGPVLLKGIHSLLPEIFGFSIRRKGQVTSTQQRDIYCSFSSNRVDAKNKCDLLQISLETLAVQAISFPFVLIIYFVCFCLQFTVPTC